MHVPARDLTLLVPCMIACMLRAIVRTVTQVPEIQSSAIASGDDDNPLL